MILPMSTSRPNDSRNINFDNDNLNISESIAPNAKSVRCKMANQEINVEMRYLTPSESIANIPYSVRPKVANYEKKMLKKYEISSWLLPNHSQHPSSKTVSRLVRYLFIIFEKHLDMFPILISIFS